MQNFTHVLHVSHNNDPNPLSLSPHSPARTEVSACRYITTSMQHQSKTAVYCDALVRFSLAVQKKTFPFYRNRYAFRTIIVAHTVFYYDDNMQSVCLRRDRSARVPRAHLSLPTDDYDRVDLFDAFQPVFAAFHNGYDYNNIFIFFLFSPCTINNTRTHSWIIAVSLSGSSSRLSLGCAWTTAMGDVWVLVSSTSSRTPPVVSVWARTMSKCCPDGGFSGPFGCRPLFAIDFSSVPNSKYVLLFLLDYYELLQK